MKSLKTILLLAIATVSVLPAMADIEITNKPANGAFAIATLQNAAPVYVSSSEAVVVKKVANMFAEDIDRVTGHKPALSISN